MQLRPLLVELRHLWRRKHSRRCGAQLGRRYGAGKAAAARRHRRRRVDVEDLTIRKEFPARGRRWRRCGTARTCGERRQRWYVRTRILLQWCIDIWWWRCDHRQRGVVQLQLVVVVVGVIFGEIECEIWIGMWQIFAAIVVVIIFVIGAHCACVCCCCGATYRFG